MPKDRSPLCRSISSDNYSCHPTLARVSGTAMTDTPTFDPILPQIEIALEIYGVSQSRFGYYACGDPALLLKLRRGMILRDKRGKKVALALAKVQKAEGIPG